MQIFCVLLKKRTLFLFLLHKKWQLKSRANLLYTLRQVLIADIMPLENRMFIDSLKYISRKTVNFLLKCIFRVRKLF